VSGVAPGRNQLEGLGSLFVVMVKITEEHDDHVGRKRKEKKIGCVLDSNLWAGG
jgi:hypothetical protein